MIAPRSALLMRCAFVAAMLLLAAISRIAAAENAFSFSVINATTLPDSEFNLRDALESTSKDNLAFVVLQGVKSGSAACSDLVYERSSEELHRAKHGVFVSLASKDWADCGAGTSPLGAVGHLNRLRDIFFADDFSLGISRLPLLRQSALPKYRSYAENTRWEVGKILFATLNLPANNNHYRMEAGRNGEFDDRLIANRAWLHHLAVYADLAKMRAIVLFSDANPLAPRKRRARRDGFEEIRRSLREFAKRFPGPILLIHGQPMEIAPTQGIRWGADIAELGVPYGIVTVTITPNSARPFSILSKPAEATSAIPRD